jgi:vacuolar-type H+-ATPase subunit H
MTHAAAGRTSSNEGAGDLAKLVSVEQGLEQRLAQARIEARDLVEEATRESEQLTLAYQEEATAARTRLQSRVEQEQRGKASEILAVGHDRATRYDALPESKIAELAAFVLQCVLRGSTA